MLLNSKKIYQHLNNSEAPLFKALSRLAIDSLTMLNNIGMVISIADGIVGIEGLSEVANGEMLDFIIGSKTITGMVLNLQSSKVSAVVLGDDSQVKPGQYVLRKNKLMGVPTGEALLGRVLDPVGNFIDAVEIKSKNTFRGYRFLEMVAPSIISRSSVNKSLETGIKIVDSMVPIGHGQRELIIGDMKTGKTSIALDTIINQKGKDTICIYVAVGQKRSSVARIRRILSEKGCLAYTIIVAATASDSAALQFIAPYSGCSMAEYFMEKGLRVLCIYDDLSKHAVAYRQLSLLLRRPPGREGYPGDVFFLHSRLLERSANMAKSGSITALPIIETIQGDVSAYIPTNVISITDGQIFLETELFYRGIRPAVSSGLSVSRVGSAAQLRVVKKLAGNLKLELAQFREVEDFTKLGFALDDATKRLVDKGLKMTTALVQQRFMPVDIVLQALYLYAIIKGFLDGINTSSMRDYEIELFNFINCTILKKVFSYSVFSELPENFLGFFFPIFTKTFIEFSNDSD